MADPLQVVSSLDILADHYTVFEPDQVLTHGQLNGVTDYLDDQTRLSRVCLDGVGLIGGLHVSASGAGVRISRGLGVTTDGDLLRLAADTTYDRFRPYDSTAPVYAPFYRGDEGESRRMLALAELVPVGESDVLAQPLSALPGGLKDMAVLMLAETVVNDPDLCSGTDCDNLGRDALHRVRLLLIDRADAKALLDAVRLAPASQRAQALPALATRRPALARDIGTTGLLAARYRDAAAATLKDLGAALPSLAANCPEVLQDIFGTDPTARWLATLNTLAASFAGSSSGLQVWYGFVKDLVDQWNELREALLADDSVLLPDVGAFPKHLLLGALAAPREQRMGLYPSPLDASSRQQSAHARFLAWKLDTLIRSFQLPTDTTTTVTPSVGDARTLEERAIPWYYRVLADAPINAAWNFALSSRRQEGQALGYRAGGWASTARARDPLAFAISGHDFFRIEGHLGRAVETVSAELRNLVSSRNLPFCVQEVLLHNDRRFIRVKPPIRHTPLHSLHYLLRQDVALRIDESQQLGSRYLADISSSVASGQVPPTTDSGAQVVSQASGALEAVKRMQSVARPVLSTTTYSAYRAQVNSDNGASWKPSYSAGLETISNTKANLGHLSRADFTSPFDSLITSNQPHWIDWLDGLILAGDNRADDKLLFTRFLQDHPALDHLGGTWRGGTFVLVYDDSGRVVGDFTLPYPAAEEAAEEPVEPPLTLPPYRPPVAVAGGIRVLRPLDLKVQDSVALQRSQFQFDLDKQTANIAGLVQGAFIPSNAVVPGKLTDGLLSGNAYLDFSARDMAAQQQRVKQLQEIVTLPTLAEDSRKQAQQDLAKAQNDLAAAVGNVTSQVVKGNVDLASSSGLALSQQLTGSVALIQDSGAKLQLNNQLGGIVAAPGSAPAALIGNLRIIGRLG